VSGDPDPQDPPESRDIGPIKYFSAKVGRDLTDRQEMRRMCGVFTQMGSWESVVAYSEALSSTEGDTTETVTPMRPATVVCLNEKGERHTRKMRWGAPEKGSKAPGNFPRHIHATAEKLDTYWRYMAESRGILIVKTFNEGQDIGSKTIQHTITPNDGKPLGIAVIYERWIHDDGGELYTFVMMTTPANKQIRDGEVTDRMPAILSPDKWDVWLGETHASIEEAQALLVPVDGDWTMEARSPKPRKSDKAKSPTSQFDLF
jgi:putative SOS response-associated peptidase YedK